ncbi:YsnF/AvaK domain-containing protein [Pararoseomonas indoligenes]|uniref:YsnF/AvaK domain-containing protein n=1 Tax=Roseomonas indoligenes TaxID=2820811 RepID=A0A940S7K7_9PROT|nr:YsnF/AvaK domain-containing protein [Pararoseomonas indoligenes]MBP0493183.1 YsnF/AvaK domain-containing protein [Pararoseomonas indoligenes]
MTRTITGLFDTRAEADAVVEHLRQHDGVNPGKISVHGAATTATGAGAAEDRGFWASLRDLFIPDEDRYAYSEGIRRGGYVVTAELDDALVDHALDIFEQHGAVDLDAREAEWRASGWNGYEADDSAGTGVPMNTSAAVGAATMGGTSTPAVAGTPLPVAGGTTAGGVGTSSTAMGAGAAGMGSTAMGTDAAGMGAMGANGTREERIPVVEEQLRVAKREMNSGRVRVRSYIVETPVNESVTLRDEHVQVERRPVDLPLSAADDAFRERTIEAVEHSEEAVVSKEARVKEELVIRKQVEERTQNISDTVRHTEVEVEDDRKAGTTAAGTTTTGTGRTPGV